MAKTDFEECLAITLTHEGGWADHPRDPGGATMKGVTLATFRHYRPGATKDDLRAISGADLARIYRDGYWNPVRGNDLPAGVNLAVFDFGVNSGPARARRHLQGAVGAKQDGVIGPETMDAVRSKRGDDLVRAICARRMSFVRGLRTWEVFGRGWSRRIADIEARGVAMWLTRNATPAGAKMAMEDEADRLRRRSKQQTDGASAASGAGLGGGAVDVAVDPSMLLIGAAVLLVIGGLLFLKARSSKDRAEAYAQVANE